MTNESDNKTTNDWNKLAIEALDLWQGHLNAIATDPKVKEDMARLVEPMTQAFAQWTSMMQNSFTGMSPFTPSAPTAEQEAPPPADPLTGEEGEAPSACATQDEDAAPVVNGAAPTASLSDMGEVAAAMSEVMAQAVANVMTAPAVSVAPATTDNTQDKAEPPRVEAAVEPLPVSDPAAATAGSEPVSGASQPVDAPARGRAASADGPRDLAQLAGRLAQLERELDSLRAKPKRGGGEEQPASESAIVGGVQRVAGAD